MNNKFTIRYVINIQCLFNILVNFLSVNGFIISNHWNRMPDFHKAVGPMIASGQVKVQEDITEGLENAPEAFIKLLTGGNTGKAIVKVI